MTMEFAENSIIEKEKRLIVKRIFHTDLLDALTFQQI